MARTRMVIFMLLEKLSNYSNRLAKVGCIVLFLIMTISAVTQVFTRYVLNSSLSWTEELARFSFIWLNILGASIAVKHKSHAAVSLLVDHLPKMFKRIVVLAADILMIFSAYLMVAQGFKMVAVTMRQLSPAINIPMGYVYLSVPVSGLVIVLHKLWDCYSSLFMPCSTKQIIS